MATPDRLRLGIIGIGGWALYHHVPDIRATGRAELVAISRRNPRALAQAKAVSGAPEAYADWQDMLEKARLDAVLVTTSHGSHAAPTIAALELGLPVLVEKPMALTSEDAWAMVRAAEASGKPLMVAYQLWHCNGMWRTAKRLLSEGAIGAILQVGVTYADDDGRFTHDAARLGRWYQSVREIVRELGIPDDLPESPSDYWRIANGYADVGGGNFVEMGTHYCDLTLWLGGASATTVSAFSEPKGQRVERYITATARLTNGAIASLIANGATSMRSQVAVIGDQGTLTGEVTNIYQAPELWLERGGKRERVVSQYEDQTGVGAFVATVLDGAPNLSPGCDAAHVVDFTEAAYRSALEERVVTIQAPEVPRSGSSPSSAPFTVV